MTTVFFVSQGASDYNAHGLWIVYLSIKYVSRHTELQDTLSDTSVRDKSLSQTDFNNCTHSNNRTIELV